MMRPGKFWLLTVVGAAMVSAVPGVGGGLALLVLVAAFVMRSRAGSESRRRVGLSDHRVALPSAQGTEVTVVGTGYHDGVDYLKQGVTVAAELRREKGNHYDTNAVAVWTGNPSQLTGYVPRELAAVLGPRMDATRTQMSRTVAQLGDGALKVLVPTPLDEGLGRSAMGTSDPRLWPSLWSPWGRATEYLEVEDEYQFRGQVASVFELGGVELDDDGSTLESVGVLASSLTDPSTVFVVTSGHTIGRLNPSDARRFRDQIAAADADQSHIPVSLRLWARDDEGIVRSRASIQVCTPDKIQPPENLPAIPHVILPHGSKVQVTGEEAHLNELAAMLAGRSEVAAVATLHEAPPVGRAAKTRVEVRIDDDRVGTLSPTMSEHFLPTIQAAAEEGLIVACRASVVGNLLKADVILDAAKSGDLTHEWITANVCRGSADESEMGGSGQVPAT